MTLYHATAHQEPLHVLQPHDNVTVSGLRGAFVFATDNLSSAHCYALKTPDMRASFSLGGLPAALIDNREKFFDEKPSGRIYQFARTGFQQIHVIDEATEEWVSRNPVAVKHEDSLNIDFDKALAVNAQFFFIEPGKADDCLKLLRRHDHTDAFQRLGELLHAGMITYENERRGLKTYVVPRTADYVPPSW